MVKRISEIVYVLTGRTHTDLLHHSVARYPQSAGAHCQPLFSLRRSHASVPCPPPPPPPKLPLPPTARIAPTSSCAKPIPAAAHPRQQVQPLSGPFPRLFAALCAPSGSASSPNRPMLPRHRPSPLGQWRPVTLSPHLVHPSAHAAHLALSSFGPAAAACRAARPRLAAASVPSASRPDKRGPDKTGRPAPSPTSHRPPSPTDARPAATAPQPLASPSGKGRLCHAACAGSPTTEPHCRDRPGAKAYKESTPSILSIPSPSSPFPGKPSCHGPLFLAAVAHRRRPVSLAIFPRAQVQKKPRPSEQLIELSAPPLRHRSHCAPRRPAADSLLSVSRPIGVLSFVFFVSVALKTSSRPCRTPPRVFLTAASPFRCRNAIVTGEIRFLRRRAVLVCFHPNRLAGPVHRTALSPPMKSWLRLSQRWLAAGRAMSVHRACIIEAVPCHARPARLGQAPCWASRATPGPLGRCAVGCEA
jgi:hypothetical protein